MNLFLAGVLNCGRRSCGRVSFSSVYMSNGRTTCSVPRNLSSVARHFRVGENNVYPAPSLGYLQKYLFCHSVRQFRVSPRRDVNPLVWLIVRPAFKVLAALTGRGVRKWWRDLPPNKRKHFLGVLKQNKVKIWASFAVFGLFMFLYYELHLQETPLTKRNRFMAFNAQQFKVIAESEFREICKLYQSQFLPTHHPYTQRVATVVDQLLQANKDIPEVHDKKWTIAVINSPMENAFVLPNGEIFVFVGMLKLCSNNDQLGAVLSHEMSHSILSHGAENFSLIHLVDWFLIIAIAAVWALLPSDSLALFTNWLVKQAVDILLHLPYNRKLETEADEVGLSLAAKACFDVRENSAFWAKMAVISAKPYDGPDIEFLSTHPSHQNRSCHLDSLMDQALKLRAACGCPALKSRDPRLDVERLAKLLEEERRNYRLQDVTVTLIPRPPGS